MLARVGACVLAIAGALFLAGAGCNEAGEGDRCNPLRSSDECGGGLHCSGNPIGVSATYPIAFCPENYCCPAMPGPSDSPYCQPGCNGGAAALCTADSTNTAACDFASCAADAAEPSTCPIESGDAGAGGDSGGGDDGAIAPAEGGQESAAPEGGDASTSG